MKKVWVRAIPWDKAIVTTALENGADAIMVAEEDVPKVKQLGLIQTISPSGDIRLGRDVVEWEIKGKKDEDEILKLSRDKMVIVRTKDWTIIPLENLIAQTEGLIAEVSGSQETETALGILEKGVDGVLINSKDPLEVKEAITLARKTHQTLPLKIAKILRVEPCGMGDRVCIDTCTTMAQGQGMLVGNSSRALFLVHSETVVNPYVEPRPFRVNAGAVHAYILLPDNKTKYLSELKSGEQALLVDYQGKAEKAVVGRVKVERRPLLFIEAEQIETEQETEQETKQEGERLTTILQNAETIRLTQPNGEPISVVDLRPGSEVLVYIEDAGRHFGMKIKETITEK